MDTILFSIWLIWLLGILALTAPREAPTHADTQMAAAQAPPTTSAK
jgi:uncharacterized membrane protein